MDSGAGAVRESDDPGVGSEEFQSRLCVWFEERGVLSELRTHLRHHMIETLKASPLGREMSVEKKKNINLSPRYQAINLLIAEYLLHQDYQYSMSVFSSEVGTLYSLPKYSHNGQKLKFHGRDVWDILEALGLPEECEEAQGIYSAYNGSEDKVSTQYSCLLECVLRMLPLVLRTKHFKGIDGLDNKDKLEKNTVRNNTDNLISEKNVQKESKIFRESGTQCNCGETSEQMIEITIQQIHENMQRAFDHEVEIAKEEERRRYATIIEEKESSMRQQLEQERNKMRKTEVKIKENAGKEIDGERRKLYEELKMKELELEREVARQLEIERYKILNEYKEIVQSKKSGDDSKLPDYLSVALHNVEVQSRILKEKEELLDKRLREIGRKFNLKKEITNLSKSSATDYNSTLEEEREKIRQLKNDLEMAIKRLENDRNITTATVKRETISKDVQTEKLIVCKDTQTEHVPSDHDAPVPNGGFKQFSHETTQSSKSDDLLQSLHKENSHLKSLTARQNKQIENLMSKQWNMSAEVSESRLQVQNLSKQLEDLHGTSTIAPSYSRSQILKEMLSGRSVKHRKHFLQYGSSVSHKQLHKNHSSDSSTEEKSLERKRHKKSRSQQHMKYSHNTTPDDEDSPTDEILKEAKRRLRMLELETEAVDRSYQEFKQKQEMEKKSLKESKDNKERRFTTIPKSHRLNITGYTKKVDTDISTASDDIYPMYNTFRRVHEPTMNIDKNLLQSYVTANTYKHSPSSTATKVFFQNNIYQTNRPLFTTNIPSTNKFQGTTALLLKRIENCTSNIRKYNMLEKQNNIENKLTIDNWRSKSILKNELYNMEDNSSPTKNHRDDDYSQYIGNSSQQYKIKPTMHWRNIQNAQKLAGNCNALDRVSPIKKASKTMETVVDEDKREWTVNNPQGDLTQCTGKTFNDNETDVTKEEKFMKGTEDITEDKKINTFSSMNISRTQTSQKEQSSVMTGRAENLPNSYDNIIEHLEGEQTNIDKPPEEEFIDVPELLKSDSVENSKEVITPAILSASESTDKNNDLKTGQIESVSISVNPSVDNILLDNSVTNNATSKIVYNEESNSSDSVQPVLNSVPVTPKLSLSQSKHEDSNTFSTNSESNKVVHDLENFQVEKEVSVRSITFSKVDSDEKEDKKTVEFDTSVHSSTGSDGIKENLTETKHNTANLEENITYEDIPVSEIKIPHPMNDIEQAVETSSIEASEKSSISVPQVEDEEEDNFWA